MTITHLDKKQLKEHITAMQKELSGISSDKGMKTFPELRTSKVTQHSGATNPLILYATRPLVYKKLYGNMKPEEIKTPSSTEFDGMETFPEFRTDEVTTTPFVGSKGCNCVYIDGYFTNM